MINRRYSVIKELGQGRSVAYLCKDHEQSKKNVVLKILSLPSFEEEKRILKFEFETLQKLEHPNIIKAYERGTVLEMSENEPVFIGSHYLALEFFDGVQLKFYQFQNELELRIITGQICSVLFYLHQSKYIYYDLKLENILVQTIQGKPFIKLIDLGFARSYKQGITSSGTAEYIAPEILKNDPHDHRVDLYSLGILLYRLIYGVFPIESSNEMEIYKEHINKDFDFPEASFSPELINVVRRLLNKNPNDRYFSSIQILYDLEFNLSEELYHDWIPAFVFTNRKDIINIVNRYVSTPYSGEIIIINGFEKAGKTSLLREIYSKYDKAIFIPNEKTKTGIEFLKFLINKIIFNDFIFRKLEIETLSLIEKIINNQSKNLETDIKLVFNKIAHVSNFILLLDDFNLFNNFALEIFKIILPIFQINGCHIILAEKSELDGATGFINNSALLDLTPFTTDQVSELLDGMYADFFPIDEIRKLIIRHADFLPGNIIEFIRELVRMKIVRFELNGISLVSDDNADKMLQNLYHDIYEIRYSTLTPDEIKVAELLSSLEIVPEEELLIRLTDHSQDEFRKIIAELKRKNIFQSLSHSAISFTSDAMKKYFYSQIPNKKSYHEKLALTISLKISDFSKVELARHYQICDKIDDSFYLLMAEVNTAERMSAFKYAVGILEQLLKLPVDSQKLIEVRVKLLSFYDSLNNFQQSYLISSQLLKCELQPEERKNLLVSYGSSLIRIGEIRQGMDLLKSLLPSTSDTAHRIKLLLDIAGAALDINNYEETVKICHEVIQNPFSTYLNRGDAYNLLGLGEINYRNDLNSALNNFSKCKIEYEKSGSKQHIAAIEGNLGIIYNMRGDFKEVEKHWNISLEISSALGNYYHQGQVLLNFGVYYFNRQSFDTAIQTYKRANLIFTTLGDKLGLGRSESNLGEVYLFICEYQNSINSLNNALEIFRDLQNHVEQSEILFLLGKLYYKLGDYSKLSDVILELRGIADINEQLARIDLYLDFLDSIEKLCVLNDDKLNVDSLLVTAEKFARYEDRINAFETMMFIVHYLLIKEDITYVYELLTNKKFENIFTSNNYFKAQQLVLLGKIAQKNPDLDLDIPITYFQNALQALNELTITELTWQVIFEISTYYLKRGNSSNAKEYSSYGLSLLKHFAQQFSNERLKSIFLNKLERQLAEDKFSEILNTQ